MPNIVGTTGDDDIDVTNDDGTLNGTSQGTPINNIRARGGDDTISVTDSTIANDVRGNGGSDIITVSGSTVSGVVHGGSGADTISISGSDIEEIRLGGGNDTLDLIGSTVSEEISGGGGTDSINLPTGTIITDDTFGTITVADGVSYSVSSGTFTLPSGTVITYSGMENGTGIACFTRDTLIQTATGPVPVQNLRVGDLVLTRDHGPQPIRWIGSRRLSQGDLLGDPKLRPVRIVAHALGNGLPERDLVVSRQHRMVVQSKIAERMFGVDAVLIPAIKLTALPGIFVDEDVQDVEYFHMLFDQHEIITAEGAPTESLYTGPEALNAIGPEAREEILTLFPEMTEVDYLPRPARYIPKRKVQKRLIARHLKNRKPLLGDTGQDALIR